MLSDAEYKLLTGLQPHERPHHHLCPMCGMAWLHVNYPRYYHNFHEHTCYKVSDGAYPSLMCHGCRGNLV